MNWINLVRELARQMNDAADDACEQCNNHKLYNVSIVSELRDTSIDVVSDTQLRLE